MRFVEALAAFLLERSERGFRLHLAALILLFAFGLPHLFPIRIDNTLDTLLEQGTEQERIDREIKASFGELDEILILAYHAPDGLFREPTLRLLRDADARLRAVPGVRDIFSLASTPYFENRTVEGELVLFTSPLLDEIPSDEPGLRALEAKARGNGLYRRNILSADGATAAFNIVLAPGLAPAEKERAVRGVRAVARELFLPAPGTFHLTGMHAFMETTGVEMQRDVTNLSMLSVMLLFLALALLFRDLQLAAVGILTALCANGLLFLTLRLLGREFSIATTPVPAITMGLALAYALHLLVARHEGTLDDPEEKHEIFVGAIFSCLTSTVGFASLCLNSIPTLFDFGLYAALGTLYAGGCALFVAHPLLLRVRHDPHPRFARRFKFLLNLATARGRGPILAVSTLFLLGGLLIFRMEVETDYYRYYRDAAPMTRSVDFVNATIGGQYPMVIELDTGVPDGAERADTLAFLAAFKRAFEGRVGVDKVITWLDLLEEGARAFAAEEGDAWRDDPAKVAQIADLVRSANRDLARYYATDDGRRTLLFVRTSHIHSKSFEAIWDGIGEFLARHAPAGAAHRRGGTYYRTVRSADEMAWSQFVGTFTEIVVLFSIAWLIIRSARLTAIAFLANLIPVFGVYGLLSLLGESLNMGTTTIAAISLGIGVDDTIHFVVRYLTAHRRYADPRKSVRHVIRTSAMSMLLASTMIALSFFSLSLSNIKPIFQLGVFTVVTMALCFASNIFFVPVAIGIVFPRAARRPR